MLRSLPLQLSRNFFSFSFSLSLETISLGTTSSRNDVYLAKEFLSLSLVYLEVDLKRTCFFLFCLDRPLETNSPFPLFP